MNDDRGSIGDALRAMTRRELETFALRLIAGTPDEIVESSLEGLVCDRTADIAERTVKVVESAVDGFEFDEPYLESDDDYDSESVPIGDWEILACNILDGLEEEFGGDLAELESTGDLEAGFRILGSIMDHMRQWEWGDERVLDAVELVCDSIRTNMSRTLTSAFEIL